MTEIPYKDRSAYDLRLRLYEDAVDWPGIAVFSRGRAVLGHWEVDASVIGSSHVMSIRSGSRMLTELLACEAPPAVRPLAQWQPGDSGIECASVEGLRYRFEARVLDLPDAATEIALLRSAVDLALRHPSQLGLGYRFPAAAGGPCTAETLVWASAGPRGMAARTAHCYPPEGLAVLSSTFVEHAFLVPERPEAELAEVA